MRLKSLLDSFAAGLLTSGLREKASRVCFVGGPFAEDRLAEKIEEWSAQIEAATQEASEAHDDALTVDAWRRSLDDFWSDLGYAREQALA